MISIQHSKAYRGNDIDRLCLEVRLNAQTEFALDTKERGE